MVTKVRAQFPAFAVNMAKYKGQNPREIYQYLLSASFEGNSDVMMQVGIMRVEELMLPISCSTALAGRIFNQVSYPLK